MGYGVGIAVSCGIGCRFGLDMVLLWLWPTAEVAIQSLALKNIWFPVLRFQLILLWFVGCCENFSHLCSHCGFDNLLERNWGGRKPCVWPQLVSPGPWALGMEDKAYFCLPKSDFLPMGTLWAPCSYLNHDAWNDQWTLWVARASHVFLVIPPEV